MGRICVAVLKKGKKDYVVRIGCTKRSGLYWLSRYKSEGFKRPGLTVIDIVNTHTTRFTIDQCKEMFIYELATELEASTGIVTEKVSDYKYRLKNLKALKSFLSKHENGFVISGPGDVEEPETMRSMCIIC